MEYIKLTPENLGSEHICCAISSNRDPQVASKKAWIAQRLAEGLVFLKSKERGKCFIEYIPAEFAWVPVDADGYMHINCFWVSGSMKGHGYANALLDACVQDSRAKGKTGITVISSPKKMPFLSDPNYLAHKGFQVADTAAPYYTLFYLPFDENALVPQFRAQAKAPQTDEKGFALYYTAGCPYTAKYVPLINQKAQEWGIPFQSIHINSLEQAKNAPAAWTNYALFYDGQYLTNEILSEKKFLRIAESFGYEKKSDI
ncbi:MAG: YoaP domain-containing protein [Oscillospiraceae bacterium]|nr:YoaP domain-containing protein [Oscillospiraceae bacterium]